VKKSPLLIVFIVVFIDLMGFGIVIPLLPLYGERYHPSPAMLGLLMAVYSLMQFIFVPILGRLSDRFGRRPIILLSLCGSVIGYVLFAIQTTFGVLFLSRVIAGIMGGNIAAAQAVVADVTPPEKRAHGMGLIGAAFGLGFIFGPAIAGGALHISSEAPGWFAAGLSALALLYAAIKLPETWPKEARAARSAETHTRRNWLNAEALLRALSHPQIGFLVVIFFLTTFAFSIFESVFALFLQKRLDLNIIHVTYLFVFLGLLAAIVQGGLIGRLAKHFGERRLIIWGAILLVFGYLTTMVARSVPELIFFLVFLALGAGVTSPSVSALISRLTKASEQGGTLGVNQSVSSLARIIGPMWGVYAFEQFGVPLPFITAGAAAALVLILGLIVLRVSHTSYAEHAEAG
jgi:MFS family permease